MWAQFRICSFQKHPNNALYSLRSRKWRFIFSCSCVSRCAAAEICQSRPYCHPGKVIISVSLCGQWRPFKGAGTASKDNVIFLKSPSILLFKVQFTSVVPFRGNTQRPTAPSENCCWQMDTPVSFPRTMDFLCLWHQDIPQIDTQSPSLDSYHLGIPWQGTVCLNSHQTIRDISTWTRMIF